MVGRNRFHKIACRLHVTLAYRRNEGRARYMPRAQTHMRAAHLAGMGSDGAFDNQILARRRGEPVIHLRHTTYGAVRVASEDSVGLLFDCDQCPDIRRSR